MKYIKDLIQQIKLIPANLLAYLEMRKIKINKDEWGIPLYEHLGDNFIMCSLMAEFKRRYGGKIAVIVPPKYKRLPEFFPAVDRVIIHKKLIHHSTYINMLRLLKILPLSLKKIFIRMILTPKKGKILYMHNPKENITFQKNFYKSFSDRLNIKFKPSPPTLPDEKVYKKVKRRFMENNLSIKKTIILYPITYSAPLLPEIFWERLVKEIKKKGYTVVTNVVGDDKPIKGTIPLFIPLEEQIATAEIAGTIIGVRSGIFDLLAYTKCKKIVLYTHPLSNDLKMDYSIKNLPWRGCIKEINFVSKKKKFYERIIKVILKEIEYK